MALQTTEAKPVELVGFQLVRKQTLLVIKFLAASARNQLDIIDNHHVVTFVAPGVNSRLGCRPF